LFILLHFEHSYKNRATWPHLAGHIVETHKAQEMAAFKLPLIK